MTTDATGYANKVWDLITADIDNGFVSQACGSFSELHAYTDANEYLLQAGVPWDAGDHGLDLQNEVAEKIDRRLDERLTGHVPHLDVPVTFEEISTLRGAVKVALEDPVNAPQEQFLNMLAGKLEHYYFKAINDGLAGDAAKIQP